MIGESSAPIQPPIVRRPGRLSLTAARRARAEAEAERAAIQRIQDDLLSSYVPGALPNIEEVLMEIGGPGNDEAQHLSELERVNLILAQGPATFFQEPGYLSITLFSIY